MENEEHPGRHSIRLKGFDYAQGGGYFVTTVTLRRECLFGEIAGGEMKLNALGRIVEECWQEIPKHFPNTNVDVFVVMPNHLHGIVMIQEIVSIMLIIARARHASPLPSHGTPPGSIGTIIGSFRSSVTRQARKELNSRNIWQRNYYEHIIRDERDYERIADYISTNPTHWADDEDNLNRLQSSLGANR